MLVTDRQLTSTAILYRLFVPYQPGGPGEKSLILKELTQLHKTHSMTELATALTADGGILEELVKLVPACQMALC